MVTVKKMCMMLVCMFACLQAKEEMRCAVDIGSGWMKMQMVRVDSEDNRILTLLDEPLLMYVPLANCYAQDGGLSDEIQQIAVDAFQKVLLMCQEKNIMKLGGVATEVFRKSGVSGEQLLNVLRNMAYEQFGESNVCLELITQELEGELGFLTAAALSPEIGTQDLVSWDSGNASFQLVMEDHDALGSYSMFQGATGNTPAAKLFVESIRKQSYQRGMFVNPVTPEEIKLFIDTLSNSFTIDDTFVGHIHKRDMHIVGIGGPTSMFGVAAKALGRESFSCDELGAAVRAYAVLGPYAPDFSDLDKVEPETVMTRLMLFYSVMQKLGITWVNYKASTGNVLGILLSRQFWN